MSSMISQAEVTSATDGQDSPWISWTHVWFFSVTVVLVAGWFLPLDRYLSPRQGAGYWLGILGGSMMLLLLIYPLRKRFSFLSLLGSPRAWFQFHMALGVLGPLMILYHCLYRFGATNSNVALVCMLLVSGSGVMGRYLYARIHHGLYGSRASFEEFRIESNRLRQEAAGISRILPELSAMLDASEHRIGSRLLIVPKVISASVLYRVERARIRSYVSKSLTKASAASGVLEKHERDLRASVQRYVTRRLSAARRVAEFETCAKLFGLWHVLHVPLFFMLLIAGIVHVLAVNIY